MLAERLRLHLYATRGGTNPPHIYSKMVYFLSHPRELILPSQRHLPNILSTDSPHLTLPSVETFLPSCGSSSVAYFRATRLQIHTSLLGQTTVSSLMGIFF